MKFFNPRTAIALAITLTLSSTLTPAQTSQEAGIEPTSNINPRDQAAIDDALHGWWTNALKTRDERLQWWRDARFGCFIHWGVYSELGGEYHGRKGGSYSEHIMRQLKIPREEYLKNVVEPFNPSKFNADQWVKLIKGAGMRYVVITAKHHDGFAMYPSYVSKYNIRDATKFGRDPMKELSDACHANGIRFGFYYSHAFDWEHPDAPGNDWDYKNPGGDLKLLGAENWYNLHPDVLERVKHYVDEKAIPQLQELVKKYHPDIFWFDTPQKLPPSEQIRIVKAVREADPNVVINGRAARVAHYNFGDYLDTADNPAEVRDPGGDWEAIPTVNNSYGYNKLDNHYKTPEFFVQLLAKIAAKGGNMLLNIGPKGDGTIDENATRILQGIGSWMDVNADSIRGTSRTPLDRQPWGDSTLKDHTLYLHVFHWPNDGRLVIAGLQTNITNAYFLADKDKHPLQPARLNENDSVIHIPPPAGGGGRGAGAPGGGA
ncbi:MAG: alpha-L-fucosidase, partial [Phycisphaerae bacterium]